MSTVTLPWRRVVLILDHLSNSTDRIGHRLAYLAQEDTMFDHYIKVVLTVIAATMRSVKDLGLRGGTSHSTNTTPIS
jgi:hypothetical protein